MAVRNGLYAVYQGKEYRAAKTDAGQIKLIYEGADVPQGFQETAYHNFVKTVPKEEISRLVLVKSYLSYGGGQFEIADETNNGFVIAASDKQTASRFHMQKVDRHDYRKEVPLCEAGEITESRREIK